MTTVHGGVIAEQLQQIVDRIERLEEEKKNVLEDIKQVYGEAKSNGYDSKIIRKVIALRKKDPNEMQEEEFILETYKRALGMSHNLDNLEDDNDNNGGDEAAA